MFKIVFFIVVSILLAYISRASLRVLRSHGFFRFLAWESILLLLLLNEKHWFNQPFSPPQIFSWLFLSVSIFFVLDGIRLLKLMGNTSKKRDDLKLFEFERTTVLVTNGLFKYIRHPMYSSLLLLSWGAFLKNVSVYSIILVALASVFLLMTAIIEEEECIAFFGSCYRDYMGKTKRFIPFLF